METVVVTAAAGSFPGLAEALGRLSLAVEEYPLIEFETSNLTVVDAALNRLGSYRSVALTSPRAASVLADRIQERGTVLRPEENSPVVWATGAATAAALRGALGPVRTPNQPETAPGGAAEVLAMAMLAAQAAGPVLFPCGNRHREELPERLRRGGVEVEELVCYHSILASESVAHDAAKGASVLIVASPSVAGLLIRACPPGSRPTLIAAGPTTADSARAGGWEPAAVATHPTADAVTAAVRSVLSRRSHA